MMTTAALQSFPLLLPNFYLILNSLPLYSQPLLSQISIYGLALLQGNSNSNTFVQFLKFLFHFYLDIFHQVYIMTITTTCMSCYAEVRKSPSTVQHMQRRCTQWAKSAVCIRTDGSIMLGKKLWRMVSALFRPWLLT